MKLKNAVIKFLIILIAFELILDILKLVIPSPIQYVESYYIFIIARAVFFILLLKDLYKNKAKFLFALLAVLAFPIVIQIIQVGLGNVFIHFCPQQTSNNGKQGIISLLNLFGDTSCSFQTQFYFFSYIEQPIFYIKQFYATHEFSYFWSFLFCPYIFYPFFFFKFCLFALFKANKRNPYLSLIPVVNNLTILKICRLPVYWIFILLIPFVRLFWFYHINKRLCELQCISESNAIWMTLLPSIFYGKLIFK
jgi:hypothetical protein